MDHPKTYLLSITGVALKPGESIDRFSIKTWGVTFRAVCHIPDGWRIKSGNFTTPDGVLEGQGSNGVTWLNEEGMRELDALVLVTLYAPVQRRDIKTAGGSGLIPATFKGNAIVQTDDAERRVPLTSANIRLAPASRCHVAEP